MFRGERGFTLVETLVAIFIMLIAIVAPLSIASQSLAAARKAKDNVTAFYLAQEGIELARNIRDNNILVGAPTNWNGGSLGDPSAATENGKVCYSSRGCYIDPSESQPVAQICDVSGCPNLALVALESSYIYTYDSEASSSGFTRTIIINVVTNNDGNHEINVVSKIEWKNGNFIITDNLQNWP